MRRLGGRCQRAVRRCLWVNGAASTAEILEWADADGPLLLHRHGSANLGAVKAPTIRRS
jgi:hypothetical protein